MVVTLTSFVVGGAACGVFEGRTMQDATCTVLISGSQQGDEPFLPAPSLPRAWHRPALLCCLVAALVHVQHVFYLV